MIASKSQPAQARLARLRDRAGNSRSSSGRGAVAETLLELQRTIGNAGVTALVAGEAPSVQRQVGWPQPVGSKNAGQRSVGSVERYPIYGLTVGNQDPATGNKKTKWMDDDTKEKAG